MVPALSPTVHGASEHGGCARPGRACRCPHRMPAPGCPSCWTACVPEPCSCLCLPAHSTRAASPALRLRLRSYLAAAAAAAGGGGGEGGEGGGVASPGAASAGGGDADIFPMSPDAATSAAATAFSEKVPGWVGGRAGGRWWGGPGTASISAASALHGPSMARLPGRPHCQLVCLAFRAPRVLQLGTPLSAGVGRSATVK